ncbi:DUF3883 domain-containing protein [Mesorhizobium sp. M6A.T.Cr.TU.016.01.1.1]|uniref:protein NO VEIN domain-containing protein n=1 Tax=Mesorhizobium sp. M6A.T.Cr.TU.016.01.1.1 TaxID=2493677 RepID=UPI000F7620E7|nr:DUF3883 domain-containing protein [Mesorhizobium sp. M6A.T.Cr.TU.016.01.1.1]AZO68007.1 DUF3883 domain-containing protein [Mesorhizobium sp. M6A.T.Cr.TU.016.01.1.1]
MKFAIKVLTRSDLTFFEPQYRLQNAGNQKSINLNRDVFVGELFPDLPEILAAGDGELEVRLRISGPGSDYEQIRVIRKIAKGGSYKNYRLNGEFVRNPDDNESRFNSLVPGDIALLAFEGAGQPKRIWLFVISAADPDDASLLAALSLSAGRSMASISRDTLAAIIAAAPPQHPVHDLFLEPALAADLDQAAQGDAEAIERLLKRPGRRVVSTEQLAEARRRSERTGLEGEQLVCGHLDRNSDIASWFWRSAENAISPYDFDVITSGGAAIQVEVKTTTGEHHTPFHISMAEIEAAGRAVRYDLYRLSFLDAKGAKLQVAEDVGDFARDLLKDLSVLPAGVRPDGFTVRCDHFKWSASTDLHWAEVDDA